MARNGTATAPRGKIIPEVPGTINGEQRTVVEAALTLEPLQVHQINVRIEGISPLVTHRWSEKAKRLMLSTQTGQARQKKEPKNPESDFNEARYIIDADRDGFPAVGFKASVVGAARHFDGLAMTVLKQSVFVEGIGPEQLVPIIGKPTMWESPVRVGMGTADLRYRPMYDPWSAILPIRFVASTITLEAVYALVDAAGLGGVGEWRPSSPKSLTGSYGRFRVVADN